eukprot:363066-Chlamydomonas_euryale.AAC.4
MCITHPVYTMNARSSAMTCSVLAGIWRTHDMSRIFQAAYMSRARYNATHASGCLTVGLGHTLQLVFLLDRIAASEEDASDIAQLHDIMHKKASRHSFIYAAFQTNKLSWPSAVSYITSRSLVAEADPAGTTHLFDEPFAAFTSSSARHSAMVLMLRNEASRAPVVSSQIAWLTRRRGEMSTAWRRTTPAEPMRVASSRGPLRMYAVEQMRMSRKQRHGYAAK